MRRISGVAAAGLGLALVAGSLFTLWSARRPSVLWITVDSLRPDRLPAYGYGANATPYIDYLAKNGIVFEQAVSDAPWTTAAMASTMTGRFAVNHGLRTPFVRLPEEQTTFAEVLRARGYDTAAIVGSFSLDHVFGLDRGFDSYDDRYDSPMEVAGELPHLPSALYDSVDEQRVFVARKRRADSYRSDAAVGDAAVAWLRRSSRVRPFLLWVHFFGTHRRLLPSDDVATTVRRAMGEYDAHVAEVDAQIGRILNQLTDSGRLARTIIVVQGDHGESLLQHGELTHGATLYDSALRIPVIISWPGHFHGRRVAEMVRNVDLTPTILSLLDIPFEVGQRGPAALDGRSLRPLVEGRTLEARPLLAETWLSAEASLPSFNPDGSARIPGLWRRGVRTPRWKYVHSEPHQFINFSRPPALPVDADSYRREELYDLAADPGETVNVADRHPEVLAEFRRAVEPVRPPPAQGSSNADRRGARSG